MNGRGGGSEPGAQAPARLLTDGEWDVVLDELIEDHDRIMAALEELRFVTTRPCRDLSNLMWLRGLIAVDLAEHAAAQCPEPDTHCEACQLCSAPLEPVHAEFSLLCDQWAMHLEHWPEARVNADWQAHGRAIRPLLDGLRLNIAREMTALSLMAVER